jgi:hypothetical protein
MGIAVLAENFKFSLNSWVVLCSSYAILQGTPL